MKAFAFICFSFGFVGGQDRNNYIAHNNRKTTHYSGKI